MEEELPFIPPDRTPPFRDDVPEGFDVRMDEETSDAEVADDAMGRKESRCICTLTKSTENNDLTIHVGISSKNKTFAEKQLLPVAQRLAELYATSFSASASVAPSASAQKLDSSSTGRPPRSASYILGDIALPLYCGDGEEDEQDDLLSMFGNFRVIHSVSTFVDTVLGWVNQCDGHHVVTDSWLVSQLIRANWSNAGDSRSAKRHRVPYT